MVDPLGKQEGNENNLKRSIREHIQGLSLCIILEHKKCLIIPVLLSAGITEEFPPRWGRDEQHLPPEQMRESTKLHQNKDLKSENTVQTLGNVTEGS